MTAGMGAKLPAAFGSLAPIPVFNLSFVIY